ncbi:TetR/AcrR family transcriptional regulator [Mycolicibacterium sp. XJ1819]
MAKRVVKPTAEGIRHVALDLFSTQGYDRTSIREIADRAGIRGSSMYNHFPSKEAILWDLTTQAFAKLNESWRTELDRLPPSATPTERLVAFVRADVRYHALHRDEASIINSQHRSLTSDHQEHSVKLRAEYEAILTGIVHECGDDSATASPRTKLVIFAILQMCSAVAGWYRPDGPLGIDEICDVYAGFALTLVSS